MALVMSTFTEMYDPTIEDSYTKQTVVDDETVRLDILDTAGQDEYSAMRDQYMRTGQGFMLVFDLTTRATFDELPLFAEQIARVQDKDVERVPIVVVGNKCDLAAQRAVTTLEASAFAASIGAGYIEASAKNNFNVTESFHSTVRAIKQARLAAPKPTATTANKKNNTAATKNGKAKRRSPLARLVRALTGRR